MKPYLHLWAFMVKSKLNSPNSVGGSWIKTSTEFNYLATRASQLWQQLETIFIVVSSADKITKKTVLSTKWEKIILSDLFQEEKLKSRYSDYDSTMKIIVSCNPYSDF